MVGIVYCNELNMCPYIDKYIEALERNNEDYKVILWNRSGDGKTYPSNYIVYRKKSELYISKWKKIGAFMGYYEFLHREITGNSFDKLIMLTSLPTILCYGILKRKYKNKYIYDFRDMSFERIPLYRKMVEDLIKNSYFTSLSSPGYKTVIKGKTIPSHNFRYSDLENEVKEVKPIRSKIVLLHIGIARGEEYNRRLVDIFGNDQRFEIYIVGTGNDTSKFVEYASQFDNIHVKGTYNNTMKMNYIQRCDALLYYYPCNFNNNRALANKYYDGLIYKKPLIGNINTYSGKRIIKKGLGISVDINDSGIADRIFDYLSNLEPDSFISKANNELELVVNEDKEYTKSIEKFVISK